MKRPTLPLRCLLLVVLGFLWATMGSASAFAERGDFGRSSLAAKTGAGATDEFLGVVETRLTRSGDNAVRITKPDGSWKDISPNRVKEAVPNLHPKAPPDAMERLKYDSPLPGTKGLKRTPTADELNLLDTLTK